jgi:hypothetical protein
MQITDWTLDKSPSRNTKEYWKPHLTYDLRRSMERIESKLRLANFKTQPVTPERKVELNIRPREQRTVKTRLEMSPTRPNGHKKLEIAQMPSKITNEDLTSLVALSKKTKYF